MKNYLRWYSGPDDRVSKSDMMDRTLKEVQEVLEVNRMKVHAGIMKDLSGEIQELMWDCDYELSDLIPGKAEHIGSCCWAYVGFGSRYDEYYLSREGETWTFWLVCNPTEEEDELFRLIDTTRKKATKKELAKEMLADFYEGTRGSDWLGEADDCGQAYGGKILSSDEIQKIHDAHLPED